MNYNYGVNINACRNRATLATIWITEFRTKRKYSLFYTSDGLPHLTTLDDSSLFYLRGQSSLFSCMRYVESNPADSEGWYISKLISVPNSREGEVTRKTGSLRRKYGVVYTLFYGRIRIPRNAGNIDACADSVYQALFFYLWKRAWDEATLPMEAYLVSWFSLQLRESGRRDLS